VNPDRRTSEANATFSEGLAAILATTERMLKTELSAEQRACTQSIAAWGETMLRAFEALGGPQAAPGGPEGGAPGRAASSRLRVLVAEDNAVNQTLARRLLEKLGHEVVIAENGQDALRTLEASTFDLVVMDIQMPLMDGLEATRAIRSAEAKGERRLPIVAITANAQKDNREQCLAAGMDDFLTKPLRATELAASIARACPAPQREAAPAPSHDRPTFSVETALARLSGDRQLLNDIVPILLQSGGRYVDELCRSLASADFPAAERVAHTLRGAVGNVAATSMVDVLVEVETAVRAQSAGDLRDLGARVTAAWTALERDLARFQQAEFQERARVLSPRCAKLTDALP
jgi:two-component system, sensor histidine kinase and response regulator